MNNLPDEIKRIIWEFDETYHIKYKSVRMKLNIVKNYINSIKTDFILQGMK